VATGQDEAVKMQRVPSIPQKTKLTNRQKYKKEKHRITYKRTLTLTGRMLNARLVSRTSCALNLTADRS